MKNVYKLVFFVCSIIFLSVVNATAQRYGANMNNPIQFGTINWGTVYADTENNSPNNGFGNDFGQSSDDIYYKFSLNVSSEVHISHCASPATGMDTYMYLLDASGNIVASNDDNGPLCSSYFSSISIQLNAGDYYVVSEGYASRQGDITTQVSLGGLPPGANMSNAIEAGNISSSGVFVDTKNNAPSNGYGNDFGQPSDDIYYRFTIDNDSEIEISHCNSAYNDTYISVLDVYGNLVYSNDDNGPICPSLWASLKVPLTAGTYYVVSETYGATSGNITTSISSPQIKTFQEEATTSLANLDMSSVTSGILYDKVFPLANLEAYQGASNDLPTNSDHFHQAYYELYNASLNKAGLTTPEAFNNYVSSNYLNNDHVIGILNYRYHYLDTNAINNNQLYIADNQLYDVSGRSTAPYIEATTFIATPLFPAEQVVEVGEHSFTFDSNTILNNTSLDIESISIDFDDGYGSQVLYDANSNNLKGGAQARGFFKRVARWFVNKSFLVRIIVYLSNGTTYQSQSKVVVTDPGPKTIISGCTGGDVISITGAPFDGSAYGKGVSSAGGKAYIFYSNANCGTNKITKPIIFLDGFDPTNSRDVQKIYDDYLNKEVLLPTGVNARLGDKLRADGYDIIIYDYNDSGDLLERNSLAVIELTQDLYRRYGNYLQEDFTMIGPSMGALVAQYALAYAETHNINTHTKLYISFDGPHQGANGPIGLQQFADYITQKGLASAVFKVVKDLQNGLHRLPSARQMLLHNSTADSEVPTSDYYRSIFLNNLAQVNKYPNPSNDPTKMRKVAIINGSSNLSPNQFLQPEGEMLYARVRRAGLLSIFSGRLGDRLNISINAASSSNRTTTADIWLFKPILNLLTWELPRKRYYTRPVAPNYSYDSTVGSIFGEVLTASTDNFILRIQTLIYLFQGNDTDFRHNINPTFMPSTSAIDLQVPNHPLIYNFSNENLVCTRKTPFDMVYAPTSNQLHVQATGENSVWFDNEIKGIKGMPMGNVDWPISGRDQLCTSDTYSIPTLPVGGTVNWSVSPANIVSLTNSNNIATLTPQGSGTVTLTATVTSFCGVNNISKQVIIGGQPTVTYINSYQSGPCNNGSQTWYLQATPSSAGATNWQWTVDNYSNGTFNIQSPNSQSTYITVRGGGGVSVTYTDQCGNTSARTGVTIYSNCPTGSRMVSYPNPADREMNVAYQADNTAQTSDTNQSFSSDAGSDAISVKPAVKSYSVILYNNKRQILRSAKSEKGEAVKLNTVDIPNGYYFLHIIEGKEVTRKQVIIKH